MHVIEEALQNCKFSTRCESSRFPFSLDSPSGRFQMILHDFYDTSLNDTYHPKFPGMEAMCCADCSESGQF